MLRDGPQGFGTTSAPARLQSSAQKHPVADAEYWLASCIMRPAVCLECRVDDLTRNPWCMGCRCRDGWQPWRYLGRRHEIRAH